MTCVLCMFGDKSYEDRSTSVSVEFLWVHPGVPLPKYNCIVHLPAKAAQCSIGFFGFQGVANTSFGNTSLIHLWGIKIVDSFLGRGPRVQKGFAAGPVCGISSLLVGTQELLDPLELAVGLADTQWPNTSATCCLAPLW